MLQIIDPQLDRFGIRHRTQMAGDLQMSPMRLLDRGLKVGAGDVHVCLEAIHALVGPEGNLLSRVLGRSDLVGLDEEGSWSLQIRAGHIEMRANQMARVDLTFETEVGVGLDA